VSLKTVKLAYFCLMEYVTAPKIKYPQPLPAKIKPKGFNSHRYCLNISDNQQLRVIMTNTCSYITYHIQLNLMISKILIKNCLGVEKGGFLCALTSIYLCYVVITGTSHAGFQMSVTLCDSFSTI
jgi:hypothetical protein